MKRNIFFILSSSILLIDTLHADCPDATIKCYQPWQSAFATFTVPQWFEKCGAFGCSPSNCSGDYAQECQKRYPRQCNNTCKGVKE